MKFGTLLNNLAKKAGIDTTQKEFIDLLSTDVEIPDPIADALSKGLMDIGAAKVHPEVRKAIRTEALNGVDSKVSELLEELGIQEADEITGEKNSYEKIARLARTVKAIEEKKASTSKPKEKEAYEKQIAELNQQIKATKDSLVAKEKEFNEARQADLTNFELHKRLLGKNYALPKEMDTDLKLSTAQSAINKALVAKSFKIVRDAETGALKLLNKEGLAAYNDNNEPLEIESFIDGALAQNKLLVVNDPAPNGGGGNNPTTTIISGGGGQGNQQTVAAIDSQMKELGLVQ